MTLFKTLTMSAACATVALGAMVASASAQSAMTNGPDGMEPNTLASRMPYTNRGRQPSRAMMRPGDSAYAGPRATRHRAVHRYAAMRPLVVRRAVAAPVVAPAPVAAGIVGGPLGFGSEVVGLPFRALAGIFPATGDIASNPLIIIGGPLHAAGEIAQLPFRIIGGPLGATTATY